METKSYQINRQTKLSCRFKLLYFSAVHFFLQYMTGSIPRPSQNTMEPPRSERKVLIRNSRKSVVVTCTLDEKVRSIIDVFILAVSANSRVSMDVVVQGKGQSDD